MTISDTDTLIAVTMALEEMYSTGVTKTTCRLLRKVLVFACGESTLNCFENYVFSTNGREFKTDAPADEIMQKCRI